MGIQPETWYQMSPIDRDYFTRRWIENKKKEAEENKSSWGQIASLIQSSFGGKSFGGRG